ncbi:ATP-binding protein [Bdellovibrionota bacterium FG-2]
MPTNRKHLRIAEAESENNYQILFDQASDAILTVLPTGKVDALNKAGEELTGYLKEELIGESIQLLIPDPTKHRIPERARPLARETFKIAGTYEDIAVVRKDGYVTLVDVSVRRVQGSHSKLSLAIFRDVSEKKRMERELITKHAELRNAYFQLEKQNAELHSMQETLVQSGKMAALGELAAGIAHELNQPLQGIRGYAQELQAIALPLIANQEGFKQTQDGLQEVISNADKMAKIIDYLRAFTRKSTESHEFTNVHDRIEEALKMLARQFVTRGIQVTRCYGQELPPVYANALQLEQVFINLATNARDAIEATGRGSGKVSITTRINGEFVEVQFSDDGAGMNERTKSKAFNPFFTTKEVGKGMGLGLSLSYGMISKLHGSIRVESEMGKGTVFLVRIPRDFRELG